MSITKEQAQTSLKKIHADASALNPTSLITLFEIDIESLATDLGIGLGDNEKIFRFHNNTQLIKKGIWWQGNYYILAPIKASGFEISSRGTLPVPKLSISTNEEGISFLALFKSNLSKLGDFVGAKVTRIRTFAKYLDKETFEGLIDAYDINDKDPDEYAEFPRDVYYIDRKSIENKYSIEFELASLLDVEGVQLPARLIFAKRCMWKYRGEGCCYEYATKKVDDTHGEATLPDSAPPIATELNELISDILGVGVPIKTPEAYDRLKLSTYIIGSSVYITKDGINYYFVCKVNNPSKAPPDSNYWIADKCSKCLIGCRLRYGTNGAVNVGASGLVKGRLPGGFFPAADKVR